LTAHLKSIALNELMGGTRFVEDRRLGVWDFLEILGSVTKACKSIVYVTSEMMLSKLEYCGLDSDKIGSGANQ
jgi:hypothetical protein